MIDRNDYDKALLKCLEALISMITRATVWAGDDRRASEQEVEEFNNVYYMWVSAYHDLKQAMNGDEL